MKEKSNVDADGNENKSKKRTRKRNNLKTKSSNKIPSHIKKMALKYKAARLTLLEEATPWKRMIVIEEPSGRHAKEFYHEVVLLAESENFKPSKALYAGVESDPEIVPDMLTGQKDFDVPPNKGGAY